MKIVVVGFNDKELYVDKKDGLRDPSKEATLQFDAAIANMIRAAVKGGCQFVSVRFIKEAGE